MALRDDEEFTRLLVAFGNGDEEAAAELFALVYQDLRSLARHYMRHERNDHTLQPTALAHEVYLRLFGNESIEWQDRAHFFVVGARQMRRILVDHARRTNASRRDGKWRKLPLGDLAETPQASDHALVSLDQALGDLEKLDPRASRVVEMRYFGGFTEGEIAVALDISVTTVKRDWEFAKAWLLSELGDQP